MNKNHSIYIKPKNFPLYRDNIPILLRIIVNALYLNKRLTWNPHRLDLSGCKTKKKTACQTLEICSNKQKKNTKYFICFCGTNEQLFLRTELNAPFYDSIHTLIFPFFRLSPILPHKLLCQVRSHYNSLILSLSLRTFPIITDPGTNVPVIIMCVTSNRLD